MYIYFGMVKSNCDLLSYSYRLQIIASDIEAGLGHSPRLFILNGALSVYFDEILFLKKGTFLIPL